MEAFEYAIKKDVRNNPIVREVDAARHREQWQWTAVGAFVVAVMLFLAWQRYALLRQQYRLEDLKEERAELESIGRQLHLEIDTLRAPQRIEKMATGTLRLVRPSREEA